MIGHEHIADQCKVVASANLAENLRGEIPGPNRPEKRSALMAAERDEMEVASTGDAFESFGHGQKKSGRAHPLPKPQRVGHPGNSIS